jgi:hypothetical protein
MIVFPSRFWCGLSLALQFREEYPSLPWSVVSVNGCDVPVLMDVEAVCATVRTDTASKDSLAHLFVEFTLFYTGGFDLYTRVVNSHVPNDSKGLHAVVRTLVNGTQHVLLKPLLLELQKLKTALLSSLGACVLPLPCVCLRRMKCLPPQTAHLACPFLL